MVNKNDYKLSAKFMPFGENNTAIVDRKFIDMCVDSLKDKKISPCIDGYWILRVPDNFVVGVAHKKYALAKKLLINPTRNDCIKYMPRQTYYCDHYMDKIGKDGYIIIENDNIFWREHEKKYQEWAKNPI